MVLPSLLTTGSGARGRTPFSGRSRLSNRRNISTLRFLARLLIYCDRGKTRSAGMPNSFTSGRSVTAECPQVLIENSLGV